MAKFYFSLLSLFLLITNGAAVAQASSESQNSNRYPQEFIEKYNTECMQTSMQEGLAEAEAKALCDCTINKFQNKYKLEEFKQLTINSANNDEAKATLIEVGQVCFEQILYE